MGADTSTGTHEQGMDVERDWFLQQLVSLANRGTGVQVTLVVGGSMVSGTLIGGKQYFEGVGKTLASATVNDAGGFSGDLQKQIASSYAGLGEQAYAEERPAMSLGFVHLRDASVWHGETHTPHSLWRVRLSAVDGFSLGALVKK